MAESQPFLRVLIIEDDARRVEQLCAWLEADVRPVVAAGPGRALGILSRDRGTVYAGILLDQDIQSPDASSGEETFGENAVVESIVANVSRDVPILVHSMNSRLAPEMVERLLRAGFSVTRIPMTHLTREALAEWMGEVRDSAEVRDGR
jgi:CheY-like chemotaxis protein